jgi:hypothetical protein
MPESKPRLTGTPEPRLTATAKPEPRLTAMAKPEPRLADVPDPRLTSTSEPGSGRAGPEPDALRGYLAVLAARWSAPAGWRRWLPAMSAGPGLGGSHRRRPGRW